MQRGGGGGPHGHPCGVCGLSIWGTWRTEVCNSGPGRSPCCSDWLQTATRIGAL